MLLRAGALSLALLLASRLLGVLRESAQASAFGTSGLADVAVLVLTLPDWLAGVAASGALAYVLLPAWAGRPDTEVAALQRRVGAWVLVGAAMAAMLLVLFRDASAGWLVGGLAPPLRAHAAQGLVWSAIALPGALFAALWATRLQHERDFLGMYGGNLVVNLALIGAIGVAATAAEPSGALVLLGAGLIVAMALRLLWLSWRMPAAAVAGAGSQDAAMPPAAVWLWAMLSAGLPFALPFAARSIASQAGEGGLATFHYAWKLVELPLLLAIQLVASLSFPAIARSLASTSSPADAERAIRPAFALGWAVACAAAAGLVVGAPALARLLFGWGRMPAQSLREVATWAAAGSWGLLPQAVTAVALTVLAARRGMHTAVVAYALALALLLTAGGAGVHDGAALMQVLNVGYTLVAVACVAALGARRLDWLPLGSMAWSAAATVAVLAIAWPFRSWLAAAGWLPGVLAALLAGALVLGLALWRSHELRQALRR